LVWPRSSRVAGPGWPICRRALCGPVAHNKDGWRDGGGGIAMPIKTLHLTNYWHDRSGGVSTFYRQLMDAANRHQHSMVMVVPGAQDEMQEWGKCCRIYRIAAPASPLNPDYRTIYPRAFLLSGYKHKRILAHESADLL